jgi:hypothetical protein
MTPFDDWQAARLAALVAEDGWLNLTDRLELQPGRWTVGSGAGNDLRLSVGPERLGLLELAPDLAARFETVDGVEDFMPGAGGFPLLRVPPLLLELHIVEGAPALRVRQIDHPARAGFAGIERFPFDPAWVIAADWLALEVPITRQVEMVAGRSDVVTQTHVARFGHEGQKVSLVPTHVKGSKPMFVIRDATSGRETYGASRFLIGEVERNRVWLDFNRAFNPPCAYTEFAICPLPPPENRLSFAIRAGERAPKGH